MKSIEKERVAKSYHICLKDTIEVFTKRLFYTLFDESYANEHMDGVRDLFFKMANRLAIDNAQDIWFRYKDTFKAVREKLDLDALAAERNDPAAKSLEEVYLAYPGFHAIAVYRLSHELLKLNVPIIPRMMSEYAHGLTGTDIHPGAQIGDSFFIDHATGIVIGETAIIHNDVKIYQGVTLGGLQVKKSLARTKRHPTIEDNVTIYANATILGGDVTIGANTIVGANVCVTESIPENSVLTYEKEFKLRKRTSDSK